MATIASLPTELLLAILAACPDVQTAALLSTTSKRLHELWVDNAESVIAAILRPTVPAIEDTIRFAKEQCVLRSHNSVIGDTWRFAEEDTRMMSQQTDEERLDLEDLTANIPTRCWCPLFARHIRQVDVVDRMYKSSCRPQPTSVHSHYLYFRRLAMYANNILYLPAHLKKFRAASAEWREILMQLVVQLRHCDDHTYEEKIWLGILRQSDEYEQYYKDETMFDVDEQLVVAGYELATDALWIESQMIESPSEARRIANDLQRFAHSWSDTIRKLIWDDLYAGWPRMY